MLDGRWKPLQDRFWDRIGHAIARTGVSANQITVIGTLMMLVHCAAFVWHRNVFWFGVGIALIEITDDIDGAVARVTQTRSSFGAYLDAVTDRYKELAVYAAIGLVTRAWPVLFVCVTGAMLTSYTKARAGMERPISNDAWPDLFERLERVIVLCAGLILHPFFSPTAVFGQSVLTSALVAIAIGTHVTALQRMMRARSILKS